MAASLVDATSRAVFTVLVLTRMCSAKAQSASFVFGDSLVDAGNNNYIVSLSKANYEPNGIDFGGPSGRYTNGRTIVDIIAEDLGFEDYTPPYLAPTTTGTAILRGVNYASGGGGILNHTGQIFGGRINLDAQIDNFANTRQDMISSIGDDATAELIRNALFSLTIGSNDFINNYLTPILSTAERQLVSPEAFVDSMISRFCVQLRRLFDLGARKIVVANVGPIGCIPYERDVNRDSGESCVEFPNQMAQLYNSQLRVLIKELSSSLKGSHFVYADVYHIFDDMIRNYQAYGFENADSSCCSAAGLYGGLVPCGPTSRVCPDRSQYIFWDPYHPSDAANVAITRRLMDGHAPDVWPKNIRQLVES
ncbi:hypothetical protein MLD38_036012 [Melastoma candidum]|uniref:Uncharacterized protein n=1 Tax=Melastoma candidum TaxID=119954 RepID=A0ACB9LIM8_9MYRT|nr:hypothetical protein MLD38_036012 [Melastoma candidum]